MKRQSVESTSLAAVGFNSATLALEVEFQNARVYRYYGVPWTVYSGLRDAASKRRYFNANIIRRYPYARLS